MFLTASEAKGGTAGKKEQGPSTKNLQWGIIPEEMNATGSNPYCALQEIGEGNIAISDGDRVYIYKCPKLVTSIAIHAVAMVYIPRISQLVVYCSDSPRLYFIWLRHPYKIRVHPYYFFDKVITSMYYFEKSSILVSAGNGIHLTHVTIPQQFKNSEPVPETLQFEKICDMYDDMNFTFQNPPVISRQNEMIFIYANNKICIHRANGELFQTILDIPGPYPLLFSFSDERNSLILATKSGKISVFHLEMEEDEIDFEMYDPYLEYTLQYEDIQFVKIFDSNFLVIITSDKKLLTISLKHKRVVEILRLRRNPGAIRDGINYIYVFSEQFIYPFHANFFAKIFLEEDHDIYNLHRCPSVNYAARLFFSTNTSPVNLFSMRSHKVIAKFNAAKGTREIIDIIYPRDARNDGDSLVSSKQNDSLYILYHQGPILGISFDPLSYSKRQMNNVESLLLTSPGSQIDIERVPMQSLTLPPDIRFIAMVNVENSKIPPCLACITESGFVCLFSLIRKQFYSTFNTGCSSSLCAIFSYYHQLIVIAYINGLAAVDPYSQVNVSQIKCNSYTALIMIDQNTIACGSGNGTLDIREFPSLNLIRSSQIYSIFHSKTNNALITGNTEAQQLKQQSNAITIIDFCPQRRAILTGSTSGEIYIWDENAFPLIHLDIGFDITSACFLNGNGSILFSGFQTIFKISYKILFGTKLVEKQLQLDDFDLRIDPFEPENAALDFKVQKRKTGQTQHIRMSKLVTGNDNGIEDYNYQYEIPEFSDPKYDEMIVDEGVIPFAKHYFVESPERFRLILPNLKLRADEELEEEIRKQKQEEAMKRLRNKKVKQSRTESRRKKDANGNVIGVNSVSAQMKALTTDPKDLKKRKKQSRLSVQTQSASNFYQKASRSFHASPGPKAKTPSSTFNEKMFSSSYSRHDRSQRALPFVPEIFTKSAKDLKDLKKEARKKKKADDLYERFNKGMKESNRRHKSGQENDQNNNNSRSFYLTTQAVEKIPSVPKTIQMAPRRHFEEPTSASSHLVRKKSDQQEETAINVQLSFVNPEFDLSAITEPHQPLHSKSPRVLARTHKRRKKKDDIEFDPSLSVQKISPYTPSADIQLPHENYIDEEMFTKYKIDGIDNPFGGFLFNVQEPTIEREVGKYELPPNASLRLLRKYYGENGGNPPIGDPDKVPILRISQDNDSEYVMVASSRAFTGKHGKPKHIGPTRRRNVNYTPHEPFQETISQPNVEEKENIV